MQTNYHIKVIGANPDLIGSTRLDAEDTSILRYGMPCDKIFVRGVLVCYITLETLDHSLPNNLSFEVFGAPFEGIVVNKEDLDQEVATFRYRLFINSGD